MDPRWNVDTLNYYQKSLATIEQTANEYEKNAIKTETEKFLDQYFCFKTVWETLKKEQCEKILHIVSSEKGIFPYEKIKEFYRLDLKPENGICFNKYPFYSELKQKNVNEEEYKNSKY